MADSKNLVAEKERQRKREEKQVSCRKQNWTYTKSYKENKYWNMIYLKQVSDQNNNNSCYFQALAKYRHYSKHSTYFNFI